MPRPLTGALAPIDSEYLRGKTRNLVALAAATLLAMTLWFSGSAVVPQLGAEWLLSPTQKSWMTLSVQVGFVAGALVSSLTNLSDRVSPRIVFAVCALLAGAANASIAAFAGSPGPAFALRFLTGAFLAGVYPPGMKLIATWCREDRGFGIGVLVGAITLGSAGPHLLNGLLGQDGMPAWRSVIYTTSVLAAAAAVIAAVAVRAGPFLAGSAPFNWRFAGRVFTDRPTRLANFGYLGHMWELFAMWAWVPIVLLASYRDAGWSPVAARVAGFGAVGAGALGAAAAGLLADRLGRTAVTTASLVVSGSCCLVAGFLYHQPGWLTALCLVWGFAVVADSAQFSAAVSELTDSRYVGTALTVQTSLGFLLTTVTIWILPALAGKWGWPRVFPLLALGPAFGVWAMLRLRSLPEAVRMASGNR